jgi:ATP-dependent HslUV protease ATP-binding subunit HslU
MEKVLEEISFQAPDITLKKIKVDRAYVQNALKDIIKNADLRRFIL